MLVQKFFKFPLATVCSRTRNISVHDPIFQYNVLIIKTNELTIFNKT